MEVGGIKAIKKIIKDGIHGIRNQVDEHREFKVLHHLMCLKDLWVLVFNLQGKKRKS